jgi:hypothetical protein
MGDGGFHRLRDRVRGRTSDSVRTVEVSFSERIGLV